MRRELIARARALRAAGDEHGADELQAAARATERAWVLTIHAFCRRLLAQHPLAAGLDPRFRVLDASEAARLANRAAGDALDALLAAGDDGRRARHRLLPVLAPGADDARGPHAPAQPGDERAAPAAGRRPGPLARTPGGGARAHAGRAGGGALRAPGARAPARGISCPLRRRSRRSARRSTSRTSSSARWSCSIRARRSPRSWRERFDHVMVDEFQDTNWVQLELVEHAARAQRRDADGRRREPVDLPLSQRGPRGLPRRAPRGDRAPDRDVLPLLGNFRSRPAVLAGVNDVGRTLARRVRRAHRRTDARRRTGLGGAAADPRRGPGPRRPQVGPGGDRPAAAAGRHRRRR